MSVEDRNQQFWQQTLSYSIPTCSANISAKYNIRIQLWRLIPILSPTLLEQVEVKSRVRAAHYSDESLCFLYKLCSSHMAQHCLSIPDNEQMKFKPLQAPEFIQD